MGFAAAYDATRQAAAWSMAEVIKGFAAARGQDLRAVMVEVPHRLPAGVPWADHPKLKAAPPLAENLRRKPPIADSGPRSGMTAHFAESSVRLLYYGEDAAYSRYLDLSRQAAAALKVIDASTRRFFDRAAWEEEYYLAHAWTRAVCSSIDHLRAALPGFSKRWAWDSRIIGGIAPYHADDLAKWGRYYADALRGDAPDANVIVVERDLFAASAEVAHWVLDQEGFIVPWGDACWEDGTAYTSELAIDILLGGGSGRGVVRATPPAPDASARQKRFKRGEMDEAAAAVKIVNPDWGHERVAEFIGSNVKSLMNKRLVKYHAVREALAKEKKRFEGEPRRGRRARDDDDM